MRKAKGPSMGDLSEVYFRLTGEKLWLNGKDDDKDKWYGDKENKDWKDKEGE